MSHTGSTAPIHSRKACVIYDATSGQIRHRHSVVTFVGGREPSEVQIEAEPCTSCERCPILRTAYCKCCTFRTTRCSPANAIAWTRTTKCS
jgi:hypothetical protein